MKNDYKIVITGASGWLGKELIYFLYERFGNKIYNILYPISHSFDNLTFDFGKIKCYKFNDIKNEKNIILYHLAFITKDKTTKMTKDEYIKHNINLRDEIATLISKNHILSMFYPSSGAVYKRGTSNIIDNCDDDIYGYLKIQDESFFQNLCKINNIKLLITRIFSVFGKHINKSGVYALQDMTYQAKMTGQIKINARNETYRNYINIQDLWNIVNHFILDANSENYYIFDSFGQTFEMQQLAELIFKTLKLKPNIVRDFDAKLNPDNYFGNPEKQYILLAKYNIILSNIESALVI